MCPTQVLILVSLILIIYWVIVPKNETLVSGAIGDRSYVRFYNDFDMKHPVFEMENRSDANAVQYFRYIWRGDVKSMDINLLKDGPESMMYGPRRARVWAYRFYSPVETTVTDFYNTYQIPEHVLKANPNLQLIADVKPGERFTTDRVIPAKRFFVELVL